MKKKITIVLTILISIVFLNDRVYASERLIPSYLPNCTNCSGIEFEIVGSEVTNVTDGRKGLYFENNLNIPNNTYKFTYTAYFWNKLAYRAYTYPVQNTNGVTETDVYLPANSFTILAKFGTTTGGVVYQFCSLNGVNTTGYFDVECKHPQNVSNLQGFIYYFKTESQNIDNQPIKVGYNRQVTFYEEDKSSQTIIDKQQETNDILSQDKEYNKNESQSTQEQKQEIDSYETQENNLRNQLNLNIEDTEISVNPNANNFIWEIVNKLRTMSGKIVLLFTSVLSLGIMKMILGR